jgi:glucosyl-dolichyl phosphate glucuronosyltransferase
MNDCGGGKVQPRAMDVSVIVPTCNRSASLDALLEDLGMQAGDTAFEVLVVDNRSTDDTRRVVEQHVVRDRRMRYVFERRRGAASARNAGIALAAAPILAFIDDDVRPRHDWVESIARAFDEHPEVDCIGGRIEPRWPEPPPSWLTSAHWGPLALQLGRGTSHYLDRDHAAACLVTANFACRAAVFCELGGFAPDYLRDEDREFNLRLWRAGKRGMYVDSIVAYAEIQRERLTKRYHRAWHHVTGASHARLRYRDTIDRDGRLDDDVAARARLWRGVPGFLYRELATHAARWIKHMVTSRRDAAFLDECRLRYLTSYVKTRWHGHGGHGAPQ